MMPFFLWIALVGASIVENGWDEDDEISFAKTLARKHGHNPHRHNPHTHTPRPTKYPTPQPTRFPTPQPTKFPTPQPTKFPTAIPTRVPTATLTPTQGPTLRADDLEGNFTYVGTLLQRHHPWKPRGLVFDRAKKTLYISWNDCVTYIVSDSVEGNLTGVCNSTGAVDGSSPTAKFNTPTGQLEPPTTDIPGISTKRYANCMAVGRWESSSTLPLDLYIADSGNCRIRRFSALTNETETVSGGACGFADGSSTSARYQRPTDVAVDLNANDESRRVFVADADAHRIRALILSNLTVLSIAGDGTVGHRDGASAAAKIAYPVSIAFHKDTDSLFISAFTGSHGSTIRALNLTDMRVSLVAGIPGTTGYRDGPISSALLGHVHSVSCDPYASPPILYFASDIYRLRTVDMAAQVVNSIITGSPQTSAPTATTHSPTTAAPSASPSKLPSGSPQTAAPSDSPTASPSASPQTHSPSSQCPITTAPSGSPVAVGNVSSSSSPSLSPATAAPTTGTPVTSAPSTSSPSLSPSTDTPITNAPSTSPSVTKTPTTESPTVSPTTLSPLTNAPTHTTLAPATEHPTTAPATPSPTTYSPVRAYFAEDGAASTAVFNTIFDISVADVDGGRVIYMADHQNFRIRALRAYATAAPSSSPTSCAPTSVSPSCSPTTLAPSTNSPSSSAPTSLSPTSLSPSTCAPTSSSPSTMSPSTCSPSSLAPTSLSPTSVSPTTCGPTTLSPTSLSPSTTSPSSCAPTSQAPTSLSPSSLSPTTANPSCTPTTCSPSSCAPTTAAPVPTLLVFKSARMDDSLVRINCRFALPTSVPSLPCSGYFSKDTLAIFGENPTCVWAQVDLLVVGLGAGFTAAASSSITLLPGVVSDPGNTVLVAGKTLALLPPIAPLRPTVIVKSRTKVGPCESLTISVAESMGRGGKPFQYSWTYLNASSAPLPAGVSTRISRANETVVLSSDYFLPGRSYSLRIELTNWQNASDFSIFTFNRVLGSFPVVQLQGSTDMTIRRRDLLQISPRVTPPACNTSSFLAGVFTYTSRWADVSNVSSHGSVQIAAPNQTYLAIPANTLRMGETYNFVQTARSFLNGTYTGEVATRFSVFVQMEPVVAILAGGDTLSMVSVPGFTYEFDASRSFDPANESAILQYSWEFLDAHGGTVFLNGAASATNPGVHVVDTGGFAQNTSYLVRVTVQGETIGGQIRTAQAVQWIYVSDKEIPLLKMQVQSPYSPKYSTQERLTLSATLLNYNASSVQLTWTCDSGNFAVNDRSLLANEPQNNLELVISADALTTNALFGFRIQAVSIEDSSVGSAIIEFRTNGPPVLGTCGANPSSGVALLTIFSLECRGWEDVDLPLAYEFSRKDAGGIFVKLSFGQAFPIFPTLLPAPPVNSTRLDISASIADSLGEYSMYSFSVEVEPQALSVADVRRLNTITDDLVESGDVMTAAVMIQGVAAALRIPLSSSPSSPVPVEPLLLEDKVEAVDQLASNLNLLSTGIDKVAGKSSLVSSLTGLCATVYSYSSPEEISSSARDLGAGMLSRLLRQAPDDFDVPSLRSTLDSVDKIFDSLTGNPSGYSEREWEELNEFSRNMSLMMTERLLKDLTVDEDPVEIAVPGAALVVAKVSVTAFDDNVIPVESQDAFVRLGALPAGLVAAGASIGIRVGFKKLSNYPAQPPPLGSSGGASGLLSIDVMRGGVVLNITNAPTNFTLGFPLPPGLRVDDAQSQYHDLECRFWEDARANWSTDGVFLESIYPENFTCLTNHLTDFNAEVNINTISAEDIKAEAFAMDQPIMLFCFFVVLIYMAVGAYSCKKDRDLRRALPQASDDFWKLKNHLSVQTLTQTPRSWKIVKERIIWAGRIKHTWTSIFIRHEGDYMNSFKRATVVFILLFNASAVCSLLEGQQQSFPLIGGQASIVIVALLFSLPVPMVFGKFFARDKPEDFLFHIDGHRATSFLMKYCWLIGLVIQLITGDEMDFEANEEGDDANEADNADENQHHEGKDNEHHDRRHNVFAISAAAGAYITTRSGIPLDSKTGRRFGFSANIRHHGIPPSPYDADEYYSMKDNEGDADKASKPVRPVESCCGCIVISDEKNATNHDYTKRDIVGIVLSCVFALGCWFLMAVLALQAQNRTEDWVWSSILTLIQDFFVRMFTLWALEIFFFAPFLIFCLCAAWGKDSAKPPQNSTVRIRFMTGKIGFYFFGKRVVLIEKDSQAADDVKLGFVIHDINDLVVDSDEDIDRELQFVHKTSCFITIGFTVDAETKRNMKSDSVRSLRLATEQYLSRFTPTPSPRNSPLLSHRSLGDPTSVKALETQPSLRANTRSLRVESIGGDAMGSRRNSSIESPRLMASFAATSNAPLSSALSIGPPVCGVITNMDERKTPSGRRASALPIVSGTILQQPNTSQFSQESSRGLGAKWMRQSKRMGATASSGRVSSTRRSIYLSALGAENARKSKQREEASARMVSMGPPSPRVSRDSSPVRSEKPSVKSTFEPELLRAGNTSSPRFPTQERRSLRYRKPIAVRVGNGQKISSDSPEQPIFGAIELPAVDNDRIQRKSRPSYKSKRSISSAVARLRTGDQKRVKQTSRSKKKDKRHRAARRQTPSIISQSSPPPSSSSSPSPSQESRRLPRMRI